MSEIRCPYCGEDDRENIIIIEDGKRLKCDMCGKVFDYEDIPWPRHKAWSYWQSIHHMATARLMNEN